MSKPTVSVKTFLNFNGRCEEAIEFYRSALGAEVEMLLRMKENPEGTPSEPGTDEKIMYSSFRVGESTIEASDCRCGGKADFHGFSLSLNVSTAAEADRYFAALAEGGTIEMPLDKTFWSPRFGVVSDRFGVSWMVNVVPE